MNFETEKEWKEVWAKLNEIDRAVEYLRNKMTEK